MITLLFIVGCGTSIGDTGQPEAKPGEITLFASVLGKTISACNVFEGEDIVGDCATPIALEEATHWLHIGDPAAGTSDDGYPLLHTAQDGLWIVDDIEATVVPNSNASRVCAANQFAHGTWECSGSDLTPAARGDVRYREGNHLELPGLALALTVEGREIRGRFEDAVIEGRFDDPWSITLTVHTAHTATRTCVAVED